MNLRIASCVAVISLAPLAVHAQSASPNPFVGAWKLVAADKLLPNGTRLPDYGAEPHGMAVFTPDGHMMIEIFRDVRTKFAANDRAKGTFEEYKDAQLSASCSFGTYSVDQTTGKVTMKIDRSTFPNTDDTTQVREYELRGDTLSWKVPPRPNGEVPISVFHRIP